MQDLSKAFKFFSLAAEQGWVDGQLQLGIMYYSMLTAVIIRIIVGRRHLSLLWTTNLTADVHSLILNL